MSKKKIIVTGGLGFIGSNLVNLLIKKNYHVIIIDKLTYASNIKYLKSNRNISIYRIDINNRKNIRFYKIIWTIN